MYFKDNGGKAVMSSYNCKDIELTKEVPDDILTALSVPGFARSEIKDGVVWTTDDQIKGDFDGIWEGDNILVQWKACCEPVNP
jgi:hypothetical protein